MNEDAKKKLDEVDMRRIALLKAIAGECEGYDMSARYAALDLARDPADEKLQAVAKQAVQKMDTLHKIRDLVIQVVNEAWPKHTELRRLADSLADEKKGEA